MISDSRYVKPGSTIESDVCIIGAGPAAIAMAREFLGTPLQVCIVEAGVPVIDSGLEDLFTGK